MSQFKPHQFKQEYLGEFVYCCDVKGCDKEATIFVDSHNSKRKPVDEKGYCDLCYQHVRNSHRVGVLNKTRVELK